MTLEQAVKVLNRENHQEYRRWAACGNELTSTPGHEDGLPTLSEFEVIAIAREYQRVKSIPKRPCPTCGSADYDTDRA
jgi:hypothetical protein